MQRRGQELELMRIIDDIVESTIRPPRLSLILAPRQIGKTYALVFHAIAYGLGHAGSVQIFACSSNFHCHFMVSTLQNILRDMNMSLLVFAFDLTLPNTSRITVMLADTIQADAACNVMYLDEFVFLDEDITLRLCNTMLPSTHIIGISTPMLNENILCRNLDDFIGKDRHVIIKFALSCQDCKNTGQEDSCVHPTV